MPRAAGPLTSVFMSTLAEVEAVVPVFWLRDLAELEPFDAGRIFVPLGRLEPKGQGKERRSSRMGADPPRRLGPVSLSEPSESFDFYQ